MINISPKTALILLAACVLVHAFGQTLFDMGVL